MLSDWSLDPISSTGLVVMGFLYLRGLHRSRKSIGRHSLAFLVGWVLVAAALISPLHAVAEDRLWAHMTQHMLLLAAPALLIAGQVGTRVLQGLDQAIRGRVASRVRPVAHRLTAPAVAWGALVVVVWGWHLPPVFEAAAGSPVLHAIEHLSLLVAATVYWSSMFDPRRRSVGAALISLFSLMLASTALGAILTLATVPLYPGYARAAAQAGADWLTDQQLAGVIMWVPMGALLLPTMLTLAARALRRTEGGAEIRTERPR